MDFPFYQTYPIHWGDIDALGHVNHAKYLTWFETIRCSFFTEVGLINSGKPKTGPILVNINVNYRAPLHFPDTVKVGLGVSRIGNTSFVLQYALFRESEPQNVVCEATTVIVLFDYEANKTIAMPESLRQQMQLFTLQ